MTPFKTEIGPVSIPTLESIRTMMPEKDWNPIPLNDDWAEHDLATGADSGNTYPQTLATRYGAIANLPEFVRKAQLANYEAHRALYEGRFARLFNPSNAVFLWMSNPSQPSFTWQIYSYDLEPFGSFFGAKKACEPVHIQMNQNDFHVMVINHTPQPLDRLQAMVRVFNLDGTSNYIHSATVFAKPSAAIDLGPIEFPSDVSPVHFVKVELRGLNDRLISDNFYWRSLPGRADNFTELDQLPMVTLDTKVVRRLGEGKCLLDVTLTNPSNSIALMAHVQLRRQSTNQRVLPVYYSDNYVSLIPGESRTISIEAADLGKDKPLVVVDGWNVTTKEQAFRDVSIAPNTDAIVVKK
jgi:beta-mannosidase